MTSRCADYGSKLSKHGPEAFSKKILAKFTPSLVKLEELWGVFREKPVKSYRAKVYSKLSQWRKPLAETN